MCHQHEKKKNSLLDAAPSADIVAGHPPASHWPEASGGRGEDRAQSQQ